MNTKLVYYTQIISTLDSEESKLENASKKGFDTIEDYEFSIAKQLCFDLTFPLSRYYYEKFEEYLCNMYLTYQNYIKTNDLDYIIGDKTYHLTIYSMSALSDAILCNLSTKLNGYLLNDNIDTESFIRQLASVFESNYNNITTNNNKRRRII